MEDQVSDFTWEIITPLVDHSAEWLHEEIGVEGFDWEYSHSNDPAHRPTFKGTSGIKVTYEWFNIIRFKREEDMVKFILKYM